MVDPEDDNDFSYYIKLTWPISIPLRYFFYLCSEYFTILLTLERYIVICHPTLAQTFRGPHISDSLKKTKIYIGGVVLFSFLINCPVFLKRSWKEGKNGKIEIDYYRGISKELFVEVYETWCWIFFHLVLPLVCLIVFNSLILKKVNIF